MPDLAAFRMNRAPDRVCEKNDRFLDLGVGLRFVAQLNDLLANAGEERLLRAVRDAAEAHLDQVPLRLLAVIVPHRKRAAADRASLLLLDELDHWLNCHGDKPDPAKFDEFLTETLAELRDAQNLDLAAVAGGDLFTDAWDSLVDILCAALLIPDRWLVAQRVSRLLLIAGLVSERLRRQGPFASGEEIFQLLRHRTPLLPSPPFPQVLAPDSVRLVRQTAVSDLYVVRSEWRCYEAAEIADITNVLAGETLETKRLRIDEQELTETVTEERAAVDEQTTETTDRSELSEETQHQVNLAVHAKGQVETSGQYGPTQVDTAIGASLDYSISDASRRATKVAREAVNKAVARVENRRRSERIERLLTRTEQTDGHSLKNPGPEHVRGVYRWVNRIDRYQVIRYPDRMQLEFQFPEPGNALMRLLSATGTATVPDPGDFDVSIEDIKRDTWAGLASQHKVAGIPPPPEATVAVSVDLTGTTTTPTKDEDLWNVDPADAHQDIPLPTGYEAKRIAMNMQADPLLGRFVREYTAHDGVETLRNFHSIHITATAGGLCKWEWHPDEVTNTIQPNRTQRSEATASWSLPADHDGFANLPKAIRDKLPVTVVAAGAESVMAAVLVECDLTDDAFDSWRQTVYDMLLTSHQQAVQDYRDEQARLALRGASSLRERSPARHEQMIQEELRRLILAWLTKASPFPGRPAVQESSTDAQLDENTDLTKALTVASEIQFLEQAFEWQNLVYVCYPYYWARPSTWDERRSLNAGDAELAQFLRAGSARVVVPARPGFQEAVVHWLTFRQPWRGGPPPQPGDDLYISVAQEIRDQLLPPEDGDPGESWEARLPTAFRWLDDSPDLPHNTRAVLGEAPNQPKILLCEHDQKQHNGGGEHNGGAGHDDAAGAGGTGADVEGPN